MERQPELQMAVDIVSAYVANNVLPASEVPKLIRDIHGALQPQETPVAARPDPAVSVRQSVRDDHIVCLEDGMKFKSLKRHLSAYHGLTPQDYRERWGLPSDYPMVAPSYAAQRSALAHKIGLGKKPKKSGNPSRAKKRKS